MSWETRPLEEVAEFRLGKMLDAKKNRGELMPYLANVNVRWGEFDLSDLREMRFEEDEVSRFELRDGDIVMCEGGEPGRCAIWKNQTTRMMIQKALHRIRPHDDLDNRFLYYSFVNLGNAGVLASLFTGSTIKHLPREKLALVQVPVPPLSVQQSIAEILCAYDDLIENNLRRMELLEASARHLYEEWFVHLRFPGYEHTTITNGLPEGWHQRQLADCSTFHSGGTPSKSVPEYWDGDIPWISSGEMAHWRIHDSVRRVTEDGAENGSRMVARNTILAVVRGMSLAKEFRVAMCSRPMTFNQDLKAIVAGPDVRPEYLYSSLLSQREQIRDRATEASHGTKKLDTAVLSETKLMVPAKRFQDIFAEFVVPLHELWDCCFSQTIKLRAARDHLLPRLMSGELVVVK